MRGMYNELVCNGEECNECGCDKCVYEGVSGVGGVSACCPRWRWIDHVNPSLAGNRN